MRHSAIKIKDPGEEASPRFPRKILTHREIEELLKQFMFYNKVTIVGINEALCRCYQVFWAGEAMNLLYQCSGWFFSKSFLFGVHFQSGFTKVLFVKYEDGDKLQNCTGETQSSDLHYGALFCKKEVTYSDFGENSPFLSVQLPEL